MTVKSPIAHIPAAAQFSHLNSFRYLTAKYPLTAKGKSTYRPAIRKIKREDRPPSSPAHFPTFVGKTLAAANIPIIYASKKVALATLSKEVRSSAIAQLNKRMPHNTKARVKRAAQGVACSLCREARYPGKTPSLARA